MLLGLTTMLAIGQPVEPALSLSKGVPAGEVVRMGVVLISALSLEQTEADPIEFVGGVQDGAPETEAALLGGDDGLAEKPALSRSPEQSEGAAEGWDDARRPGWSSR